MKKNILLLSFLFSCSLSLFAQTASQLQDIETLYQRTYSEVLSKGFVASNIETALNKLGANGRFTDVNYAMDGTVDQTYAYSPKKHQDRTLEMSIAYMTNKAGNSYYKNSALLTKLKLALADNLGRTHIPIFGWTPNWFETFIDCPKRYADCLILLRNELSSSEYTSHVNHLRDVVITKNAAGNYQFIEGGANTIWVAQVSIKKGILEKNYSMISTAFSFITGCLKYMYTDKVHLDGEGIKVDFSYHMHGSQLYMGGYGLGFIKDVLAMLKFAQGTSFKTAFPKEGMDLFCKLLLEGHQHFVFHKNYDWNTVGRQVTSPTLSNIEITADIAEDAAGVFPEKATEFLNFASYIKGGPLANTLGSKFFFKSATLTSTEKNYHLNVKMTSKRVEGTECMTNAGLKNQNIALGSTPIMTKGNEYANIYPTWDWSRIPGTTAELTYLPVIDYNYWVQATSNPFCGGASDGSTGIAGFSMAIMEDDPQAWITYRKSYFVFDGVMICLGNGIGVLEAKNNSVITSVNQCFSANNAVVNDGTERPFIGNQTVAFDHKLKWAFHENVGYIFPNGGNVVVKNDYQSGTWKSINSTYGSTVINNRVFSLWLDHGKTPANATYEYAVVPGTTISSVRSMAQSPAFQTVSNTEIVQAVKNESRGLYGAIFHKAGTVDFKNNLVIAVNKAAIVLVTGTAPNYTITVSDPLYVSNNSIKVTIYNQTLSGKNASIIDRNTVISCTMPTGYFVGSSFQNSYSGTLGLTEIADEPKIRQSSVKAYSPFNGRYQVKAEKEMKQIEVYNMQGQKVVHTKGIRSNEAQVDLSAGCSTGVYFLHILFADDTREELSVIK